MFESEESLIQEALRVAHDSSLHLDKRMEAFINLIEAYGKLLRDMKFVYRISDRLQKKLSDSHQELEVGLMARSLALERAVSELSAVNKELDNFVYRASHDIKGPIARIKGLCNIAAMEVKDETGLLYINYINDTADMMDGILNMLLSVPNLKHAQISIMLFSINVLLIKCIEVAKETVQFHDVHLKIPKEDYSIESDPMILETLFQNLMGYALKSIQEYVKNTRQPALPISFEILKEDQNYLIRFKYKGEKIPQESVNQLFHMFYRSSEHNLHTGLELYSAKVAANRLGGDVCLVSSNIKDTEFEIKLPIKYQAPTN